MKTSVSLLLLLGCFYQSSATASSFHQDSVPEWAPDYYVVGTQGTTPQFFHAVKEIHKLQLEGTQKVLDVGCGDGTISAHIAHTYVPQGAMHGVDISSSMIDAANKRHGSSSISFENISLFEYQPDQLYDAVVCFWVLYLFEDYAAALTRVMSFLKPGGKALICHVIHPGTPFCSLFARTIYPQRMPIAFPTLDTVLSAIEEWSGLIEYFEVKYNYDKYDDLNQLMAAMRKIPFFPLLQHKQAQFEQELIQYYQPACDGYVCDYAQVVCMVLKKQ